MNSKIKSQSISFRLPIGMADSVDEFAAQCGISRGNWVKGQIIAAISRPDSGSVMTLLEQTISAVEKLSEQIAGLESSQRRSLYYCLTRIGSMSSEEAQALVREKFPRKGT